MQQLHTQMQQWRRDIHKHPETAYEEFRTAKIVADQLTALGLEVHTGIGETGVVGVLKGKQASNKSIAIRADMDALNLTELNTFEHASCHIGKMHGCGHDGHTSMVLGAATYLAEHNDFAGTAYFIFQPAEEGQAGAKRMIDDGLFEHFQIDEIYGLHNWPALEPNTIAVHSGAVMASADSFKITVTGKGGHAAMPHNGIDPVLVAAHIITAAQSLVSRGTSPLDSAVVSITQMQGGDAFNVIPEVATLRGTVRTLSPEQQQQMENRLRRLVENTAAAFGAEATLDYRPGYPVTMNHVEQAKFCYETACNTIGKENTQWSPPPSMAAEDFAFFLQHKPGAYFWLGNGGGGEGGCGLHNPHYDFNDDVLVTGAQFWINLITTRLEWLSNSN